MSVKSWHATKNCKTLSVSVCLSVSLPLSFSLPLSLLLSSPTPQAKGATATGLKNSHLEESISYVRGSSEFSLLAVFYVIFSVTITFSHAYRLVGRVVKASAPKAEGPEFESRLRRDFSGAESYQ